MLPGVEAAGWNGLFAPAGTPRAIIQRLNSEINAILRERATATKFEADGTKLVVLASGGIGRINAVGGIPSLSFSGLGNAMRLAVDRSNGGVLGLRPPSRYPSLFVDAIKDSAVGQLAGPIRSAAGRSKS